MGRPTLQQKTDVKHASNDAARHAIRMAQHETMVFQQNEDESIEAQTIQNGWKKRE